MKKVLAFALYLLVCFTGFAQPVLTGEYNSQASQVDLEWNMIRHTSRTAYIILKSKDGINWTELVRDRMVRNYTDDDAYTFGDKSVIPGRSYYRIRIVDAFGSTVDQSNIIWVNTRESPAGVSKSSWIIYPNPVSDLLILNVPFRISCNITTSFFDLSGRKVEVQKEASINNELEIRFNLAEFANGIYFLKIENEKESVIKKIIKLI